MKSIIIIIVLAVVAFFLFKDKSVAPTDLKVETNQEEEVTLDTSVKEFSVEASPFKFSPATMIVNEGDTVKITLNNTGGVHDLKIDEFSVATKVLQAGESETITFIADKSGTFEYYCSVGNHRQMGMVGTLQVN